MAVSKIARMPSRMARHGPIRRRQKPSDLSHIIDGPRLKAVISRKQTLLSNRLAGRQAKAVNRAMDPSLTAQGNIQSSGLGPRAETDAGTPPDITQDLAGPGELIMPWVLALSLLALFCGGLTLVVMLVFSVL